MVTPWGHRVTGLIRVRVYIQVTLLTHFATTTVSADKVLLPKILHCLMLLLNN